MSDKKHCCCCIILSDGVLLVGIYGLSFHASLLIIQVTQGHTLTPAYPVDPHGDSVVHPILIVIHALGILLNGLLAFGSYLSKRPLMIPWLFGQGLLSVILLLLALYYLILYPRQECATELDIFTTACHILLWHSVIMVCSVLTLFYYFYIVQEFISQLGHHEKCAESNYVKDDDDEEEIQTRTHQPIFVIAEESQPVRAESKMPTAKKEKRVRIQEPF